MTSTPQSRINELTSRQVFYGSSIVIKLNAVNGKWFYKSYLWSNHDECENKSVIKQGKYNGEDPEELIKQIQTEIGVYRLGKPRTIKRLSS